jgi:hypothetical protein
MGECDEAAGQRSDLADERVEQVVSYGRGAM